jgi:alpha-galactosidase
MMTANSAIRYFETAQGRSVWVLQTARTAYALGLDQFGFLQHMYWGARLINDTDYGEPGPFAARGDRFQGCSQEEFPVWGDLNFNEPCLKATFADGVRGTVLEYDTYAVHEFDAGSELTVTLRDPHYALIVYLVYRVFPEYDIIERSAIIENTGSDAIMLERIMSAAWNFPQRQDYRLLSLDGEWGQELCIQQNMIQLGRYVIERRRGARGHDAQPWFAVDDGSASETHGEVWIGALAYSSNFKLIAHRTTSNQVMMTGGISDFDFAWKLDAGERFETPAFVGVYSSEGYGLASRLLHGYEIRHVLPQPFNQQVRPVLYNSW